MGKKRLNLPVGMQTFEELRTGDYVYVDKTKYLVDLIDKGKVYFLARPRRFGKSLTVSTFEALFSGKKELFKGLYAEEFLNRPNFQPNPVIHLDMSAVSSGNGIDDIRKSLKQQTMELAEKLRIDISTDMLESDMFRNIIVKTANKHNQKAVILLDEYDKPYTDFVNDPKMAELVRGILRDFYIQIKACDRYIYFVFITGISKFVKFGVFSTLNNLRDISMNPEYAEICGYTEDEIIQYFPDYIEETANDMQITEDELIERMCQYYDGFSFDREAKTRLYNPFSTLSFFGDRDFSSYWVETGNSKFIADYLKNRDLTVEQFRNFPVSKNFVRSPGDLDTTLPEGFLYQSGYLTLRPGTIDELALDYPNTEVLNSMSALLAQNLLGKDVVAVRRELFMALEINDTDRLIELINRLLASIPYDDYAKAAAQKIYMDGYKLRAQEWLYRTSIYSYMQGCGVMVAAETHTSMGRSDLVITYKDRIWIIELKVAYQGQDAEQKAEEALRQIKEKKYAKPYPNAVCIGLGIDDTARQITAMRIEAICELKIES